MDMEEFRSVKNSSEKKVNDILKSILVDRQLMSPSDINIIISKKFTRAEVDLLSTELIAGHIRKLIEKKKSINIIDNMFQ